MTIIAQASPPTIVAGAYTIAAIGACFAFVWLWTFDKAFRALFAPLMNRIAGIGFGGVHGVGSVHPFGFLHSIVVNVENWTKSGMAASERAIVYGFGMMLWTFYDLTFTIAKLAYDTNTAIDNVWHNLTVGTPKVIQKTIVKPIQRTIVVTKARADGRIAQLTHEVAHLTTRVDHLARATAGAIAAPFPRIGRIERDLSNVKARLKKAEKAIAVGASAALVLTALKRLGLGWLRCSNVTKTGKAVCGMNPSLLESLLLDAALLTVTFNLEEFARELQTVTGEAARLIHNFAD